MKTEQINLRLEPDLVAALERVAEEESLDRGTVVRRLLEQSLSRWRIDRALEAYRTGAYSLGRASEEAGVSHWELIDAARAASIAYPLQAEEIDERLSALADHSPAPSASSHVESDSPATLPDRPPRPRGVLMVGINPAPMSVAAGHYYQGRLGKRLWRRLERVGLLTNATPGAEDDAFVNAGHGLTDLVKRPTSSAAELNSEELEAGAGHLQAKVADWRPGLILFPFKTAAAKLLGSALGGPGQGPLFGGVPTFLLSGPYAPRAETERIDAQLRAFLGESAGKPAADVAQTQPVTARDLEAGRVRVPRSAKRHFPAAAADVEVVVRGERTAGRYDPRIGPDRERSAVLSVSRDRLARLVAPGERLRVSRGVGGVVRLD